MGKPSPRIVEIYFGRALGLSPPPLWTIRGCPLELAVLVAGCEGLEGLGGIVRVNY